MVGKKAFAWSVPMSESTSPEQLGKTAFELGLILQRDPKTCPVCRFVARGMKDYVDALFYERVTDVPTRQAIRDARGFCRRHARMVSLQADALGTTLIMEDILKNDLRDMTAGRYDQPSEATGLISRLLGQKGPGVRGGASQPKCPLCATEHEMDEAAVDGLLQGLGNPDFADQIGRSAGLCMPHFRLAFDRAEEVEGWETLHEAQKRALTELVDRLHALARTHDYRFRDEAKDADAGSWREALDVTSGVSHD
jgi:hypothetical protein